MSKVVFITGSRRRIGRGLALGFAGRGWRVAIHYGSSEDRARATLRDVEALGAEGFLVQADVRNRAAIRAAIAAARDHFGGIDVLVNNAGIYPAPTPVEDVTEEEVSVVPPREEPRSQA